MSLLQAFSEATSSDLSSLLKEKAPFTIKNCLGVPLIVRHSSNLRVMGAAAMGRLHELPVDQSMDLEHTVFESSSRGKLSTLQRQESCLFNLTMGERTHVSPSDSGLIADAACGCSEETGRDEP